ncbi:hypothetical protein [Pinibacter aurantiacus]|uniref:Uncharacterized protein n=1 Tax=Pinibacter aurantiacus TaxID=2851599 RepID=A0A9E2SCZ7_9BACT|nr:hypothetical protein [Pinibacter aurantiacus]MBV4359107.1 hypothetical protein [Pinibacter aurantiacus]
MINENFVYARIGMALISAQRVEYIANQLVDILREFDVDIFGITGQEFLTTSKKANLARATLGTVFNLLKLNHKLIIKEELDDYVGKRNILAHNFWKNHLHTKSVEQAQSAVDFCQDFGIHSQKLESFFKGFVFFLALRYVKDRTQIDNELKKWEGDFDYFMERLQEKRLQESAG